MNTFVDTHLTRNDKGMAVLRLHSEREKRHQVFEMTNENRNFSEIRNPSPVKTIR